MQGQSWANLKQNEGALKTPGLGYPRETGFDYRVLLMTLNLEGAKTGSRRGYSVIGPGVC